MFFKSGPTPMHRELMVMKIIWQSKRYTSDTTITFNGPKSNCYEGWSRFQSDYFSNKCMLNQENLPNNN